jgi:hypothetical protein
LIADVRRRPRPARARAALSYRHALGFEKIVLLAGKPDFMLRAHVWRPADERQDSMEHIHNHRFAFASRVLTGELAMDVFMPHPAGETMEWYQEKVAGDDSSWDLARLGRRTVGQLSSMSFTAGASYHLAVEALHRIRPAADSVSATLCLETATLRDATDVYVALGEVAPARIPKTPFSLDTYENALVELRKLVC